MSDCVFCMIAGKEIPSNIAYEDDQIIVRKPPAHLGKINLRLHLRDSAAFALLDRLIGDLLPAHQFLGKVALFDHHSPRCKHRNDGIHAQFDRLLNDRLHLRRFWYALKQRHARLRFGRVFLPVDNAQCHTGLANLLDLGFIFPAGTVRDRDRIADLGAQHTRQMLDVLRVL